MNNKTILQLAKGFRGRSKNCIRVARERVEKALQYAYRDRRNKKRDMRALWIQRINAGTRQHGVERSISLSQCLYQIIVSLLLFHPLIFSFCLLCRSCFWGEKQPSQTRLLFDDSFTLIVWFCWEKMSLVLERCSSLERIRATTVKCVSICCGNWISPAFKCTCFASTCFHRL